VHDFAVFDDDARAETVLIDRNRRPLSSPSAIAMVPKFFGVTNARLVLENVRVVRNRLPPRRPMRATLPTAS